MQGRENFFCQRCNAPNKSVRHRRETRPQVTLEDDLPPWQNPFHPLDMNFDGQVTPHDVVLIINAVTSAGSGHVLGGLPFQADGGLPPLVDADGVQGASP
jgi:hypothetical protein